MHFVPAHWGAARALVLLHRHSRALLTARNGLEQLPLVKLPPNFTWPGTSKIMTEALLQNVEVLLDWVIGTCMVDLIWSMCFYRTLKIMSSHCHLDFSLITTIR